MVLLLPLLSACNVWEQLGRGPGSNRFNPDEAGITARNVGSLSEAWSSRVGGSFSEPILSGDRLYTTVASPGSRSVRSYDARTGAVVWETPLAAPANAGPVVLVGGALWVAHGDRGWDCQARLTRLDPATGGILTSETGPLVRDAVVGSGTTVAFTTGGCSQTADQPQLVVRDTSSPTQSWTYRFPAGTSPTSPSIGSGKVVVAADDKLYGFDAAGCGAPTCVPRWVTSLNLDDTTVVAYEGRPVVGPDGTVYVGGVTQTTQTLVRAVDGATGAHLWRTDVHAGPGIGWQNTALAHGRLYVSDHRYDSRGGAVEVFTAAGCGQPVCAPVWSASVDGAPVGELTIAGDVLYLGVSKPGDNRFVAFDAKGCGAAACSRLANIGFGNQQPLQVAVAGGRVAVAGSGATLRVLVPRPRSVLPSGGDGKSNALEALPEIVAGPSRVSGIS